MSLSVSSLTNAQTTIEEVTCLKNVKDLIKGSHKENFKLEDLSEDDVKLLVFYLFERRYGWAESDCKNGRNKREEAKYKSSINESLDILIEW